LADELSPREEGRFARRRRRATSLRSTRRFLYEHTKVRRGSGPGPARPRGARRGPPHGNPTADRLAVTDRDRRPVRDRRREAGRRGRRPVELPGERAEDEALRVHAQRRGGGRLPPRSGRDRERRERPRGRTRQAEDPRAPRAAGDGAPRGVRPDPPAGQGDRARRRSGRGRGTDAARSVKGDRDDAEGLAPELLRGAEPGLLLGYFEDVRRPG